MNGAESFRTTYTQLLNLNLSQNSIGPSLDIFPDLNFRASEKLFLDLSRNRIKYLSYASAIENLKPNHASEGHDVQIDIIGNGNTGCRVFKKGIQNQKGFRIKINCSQMKFGELEQWRAVKKFQNLTFKVNFLSQKSFKSF